MLSSGATYTNKGLLHREDTLMIRFSALLPILSVPFRISPLPLECAFIVSTPIPVSTPIGRIYTADELSDPEFILEEDLPVSDM